MNKKLLSKFVLLISIFILSFATVGSPLHTYASESTTEIPNPPVKIIESSDTMLTYEIEEDGEILRYEADIKSNKNLTKTETKVYKEENGKLKLIDNFKTEINPTNHTDSFSVTQDGTTVIATKDNSNYDIQHQQVGMSTRAYSPWQKSSFPKLKLGYRKDFSSKKGQASYSTILRSNLSLSDKNFNEFVKRIDSLKTWEKAIIFDATVIGLIESGIKI